MKYDRFLICIILVTATITLIAIAAVFTIPAKSTSSNLSATGIPTSLPTTAPENTAQANPTGVPAADDRIPNNITWYGSVQDSFGKPFGGIKVTLHVMTAEGEAFSLTNTTATGLPYPGTYVFENVPVTPNMTYAYAEANAGNLEDGIIYYGRCNNYTLDRSRVSSGFIVLHVPMPDQLDLTVESPAISPTNVAYVGSPGTGLPTSTLVTAQLYLNGKPYKRSGTTITFLADNEEAVALPGVRTNITDETGRASILLIGNNAGKVNVTGYAKISISLNLTDTAALQVVA